MIATTTRDQRVALPIIVSSTWASTSGGSGGDEPSGLSFIGNTFSHRGWPESLGGAQGRAAQFRSARSLKRIDDCGLGGVIGCRIGAARDTHGAVLRIVIRKILRVFLPMIAGLCLIAELRVNQSQRVVRG